MIDALGDLLRAAVEVQAAFEKHGWRFCLIGGVAVQRWGRPRFTQDIDVTLLTGFGAEDSYLDLLLEDLEPRHDDGRAFALAHRVLLARTRDGAVALSFPVAYGAI